LALIASVLLGWTRRLRWPRRPVSPGACLAALCLGWCCRLTAVFLLTVAGFHFPEADDPCRWRLSWSWAEHPYFLRCTDIWPVGTFALHGLAMKWSADPLVASKLVSAIFCLLPLIGLFIFSLGLFNDRRPACAAVLVGAPVWLHLTLSTGSMSEMPTITLMLIAAGLLLLGLRRPPSQGRFWLLAASACTFNLATMFHLTCWMQLGAVLTGLFVYSLSPFGRAGCFNWRQWLFFSLAALAFCLAWVIGNTIHFGDPFYNLKIYAGYLIRDQGRAPWRVCLVVYPLSILYTLKPVLPLLVFGPAWCLWSKGREQGLLRGVLLTIGLALLIMVAIAIKGGTYAPHPHRATIMLSTALIPFLVAPFFPSSTRSPRPGPTSSPSLRITQKHILAGLALLAGCLLVLVNYQMALNHLDTREERGADGFAMGAWLRQEMIHPRILDPRDLKMPICMLKEDKPSFPVIVQYLSIDYAAGFLNRIEEGRSGSLGSLRPGQIVIACTAQSDPRFKPITRIGSFYVYKFGERHKKHHHEDQ
jgi:hypothetical protein